MLEVVVKINLKILHQMSFRIIKSLDCILLQSAKSRHANYLQNSEKYFFMAKEIDENLEEAVAMEFTFDDKACSKGYKGNFDGVWFRLIITVEVSKLK